MPLTLFKNASFYNMTSRRFEYGSLCVKDGYILDIYKADSHLRFDEVDLDGAYVLPGLVDVHTHGRGGYETTEASPAEFTEMAKSYARAGTTAFLPTIMSVPLPIIEASIDHIAAAQPLCETTPGCAHILGTHLEGRYLNPKRKGAHNPEFLTLPDTAELAALIARSRVLNPAARFHITCAPELDGGESFVRYAAEHDATVAIGHSDATCAQCEAAMKWGATAFTHLYNAMSPLSHRAPGCVGAALSTEAFAELICDGKHVAPEVVKLSYRAKSDGRLVLITDSAPAAGLPDGTYTMGGAEVIIGNGAAWLTDGTLTGSIIDLFTAIKNLADFAQVSLEEVIPCATLNPARMVGADREVGSLEPGKRADFIVTDRNLSRINDVYISGRRAE